jgi:hypothetical protein
MNLSLVAINRYIVVCRSQELYAKMYTFKKTAFSIALPWMIAVIFFTPPFYGLGTYDYNTKFGVCIFMSGDVATYWFIFGLADCTIMFPTTPLTLFCYVSIMLRFRASKRKVGGASATESTGTNNQVNKPPSDDTSTQPPKGNLQALQRKKLKESGKQMRAVTKNMFIIWLTFLTCWMPLVLTYKIDYYSTAPNEVYHVLFAIAQSNSALNFILYCGLNKNFREAYIEILTLKAFKN